MYPAQARRRPFRLGVRALLSPTNRRSSPARTEILSAACRSVLHAWGPERQMGSTSLTMTGQLPPASMSTLPAMDPPHGIDSFT
jgi:hypothetical protein